MKKPLKMKGAGVVLLCAVVLSACNGNSETAVTASPEATKAATTNTKTVSTTSTKAATTDVIKKVDYAADDAYSDWASANPTKIALSGTNATFEGKGAEVKNGKITITAAGTYVVSGKLDEGQIVVNVKDKGVVRIVLNGAEIHNSTTSAIYVEEAGKTILSLQEGTSNLVSDGKTYVYPDASTDEPNAAIFSKDDLTINGTGKLVVQGNFNNGITSKDKLKITGGNLDIHAVDNGLMGKDLVAVQAGTFTIAAAEGHGIKTSNDKEGEEGYISLAGGSFKITSGKDALHSSGGLDVSGGDLKINAGDDGIHAEVSLAIAGGTIDIAQSNEGIEAPAIVISGGHTSLVASDDGVNVSSGDAESAEGGGAPGSARPTAGGGAGGPGGGAGGRPGESGANSSNMLTITGGYLSVDSKGDGLDSNGSITMSGGTVVVNGPTENNNGALDYDGTFVMTGGFLVAAGSSGMVQATSDTSTQAGVLMTYTKTQQAGTLLHLADSAGKNVITFAPSKNYQSVFISSPNVKKDASYTLSSGGTATGTSVKGLYEDGSTYQGGTKVVDFKTSTLITWLSETGVTAARSGMGGPGGGFGGGGGGGGGMRPEGGGQRPQKTQ